MDNNLFGVEKVKPYDKNARGWHADIIIYHDAIGVKNRGCARGSRHKLFKSFKDNILSGLVFRNCMCSRAVAW